MSTTTDVDRPTLRRVADVVGDGHYHWVGDGFRVEGLFTPGDRLASLLDPFLLLDYHAPHRYEPTDVPRGVGVHPHRGFETVTLAFDGSVAHHDSTGAGGVIRPGDVQWMTAASGILHKEYHEAEWARGSGTFHMALGAGYPETGSHNRSSIHWDMICDLRTDSEILVDGELFYKNGEFVFDQ